MKKASLLLLSIITLCCSSQKIDGNIKTKISGIIYDDFNITLELALVKNKRTQETVLTKCNGEFELESKIGDTLEIQKPLYKKRIFLVNNITKVNINLFMDGDQVSEKLNRKGNLKHQVYNPEQRQNLLKGLKGSSEPLLLLNRDFIIISSYEIAKWDIEDIQDIEIIRRDKAKRIFGGYHVNGMILITKKCYE